MGNNLPAKVRTGVYLSYDDRYFYIGVRAEDPEPKKIRAPYVERDGVIGTDDNIAVFLDTRGDRRMGLELRVNPRGIQADGFYDDAGPVEDFSPDYFYDTAAKIDAGGWSAEYRIPFSSLRYSSRNPTWNILVWRNYPRDFRYAFFNAPVPRGSNCLVCRIGAQLLMSFEGAIDVVAGDTVRAVFGVPYAKGDDAIRAVRAAMALRNEWERLSLKRGSSKERFQVRAGLTTGKVFAGAVGTEARLDPVLLGEPVTVAGLLCASAEPGQLLLTGKSLAHVGARFDVTPLGERLLLGQKTKVAVFEVLDEDSDSGTLSGIR